MQTTFQMLFLSKKFLFLTNCFELSSQGPIGIVPAPVQALACKCNIDPSQSFQTKLVRYAMARSEVHGLLSQLSVMYIYIYTCIYVLLNMSTMPIMSNLFHESETKSEPESLNHINTYSPPTAVPSILTTRPRPILQKTDWHWPIGPRHCPQN